MGISKLLPIRPTRIIRKGNQFVRTKTILTPSKTTVARLTKNEMTINGQKVDVMDIMNGENGNLTPKDAIETLFNNFEKLYSPKYKKLADEMIKRAFS